MWKVRIAPEDELGSYMTQNSIMEKELGGERERSHFFLIYRLFMVVGVTPHIHDTGTISFRCQTEEGWRVSFRQISSTLGCSQGSPRIPPWLRVDPGSSRF